MAEVSRILAVLAIVVMLLALPLTAYAQQSPPHVLIGTATLNGATPPIGTEVVAMAGDAKLGSAMTTAGGQFTLQVQRPPGGGAVTFMIAGVNTIQRLAQWEIGKIQSGFNLNATASVPTGNEPPHVLIGTAMLNGAVPQIGTEIVAVVGDTRLGTTLTRANGKFAIQVVRPPGSGVVTFTVGGVTATERLTDWEFGKIQTGFNLTTRRIPVAEALAPLIESNNLVSVWHFDNSTKAWYFYVPGLAEDNTLDTMSANGTYLNPGGEQCGSCPEWDQQDSNLHGRELLEPSNLVTYGRPSTDYSRYSDEI